MRNEGCTKCVKRMTDIKKIDDSILNCAMDHPTSDFCRVTSVRDQPSSRNSDYSPGFEFLIDSKKNMIRRATCFLLPLIVLRLVRRLAAPRRRPFRGRREREQGLPLRDRYPRGRVVGERVDECVSRAATHCGTQRYRRTPYVFANANARLHPPRAK